MKDQTSVTIDQLQRLSGPEVLQALANEFERVNLPAQQQSFIFESLASDATRLIPLFQNQGAELERLADRYSDLNQQLQLTGEQSEQITDLAESFSLLSETSSSAIQQIVADLGPTLTPVIDRLSSRLSAISESYSLFIQSFSQGTEGNLLERIGENNEIIEDAREQLERPFLSGPLRQAAENRIRFAQEENAQLSAQIDLLNQRNNQQEFTFEGPNIDPNLLRDRQQASSSTFVGPEINPLLLRQRIEAMDEADRLSTASSEQSFLQQVEIDARRLAQMEAVADQELETIRRLNFSRLDLINQQEEDRIARIQELRDQELINEQEFEDARTEITENGNNQRAALEQQNTQFLLQSSGQLFDSLAGLAESYGGRQNGVFRALFAASKAFAIADSIIKIQQGIAAAASIGFPGNIPAIAQTIAATSSVLSTIQSASFSPRQQGGQFDAGQRMLVGERGPELVEFGAGGRVAPNSDIRGSSSANVQIINQAPGIQVDQEPDNEGRLRFVIREEIASQVAQPNSQFNKNLTRTRQAPRSFG